MGRGRSYEERQPCYACFGCICCIGILLTIILLPLSFNRLEFYEAGLKKQKSTGKVDMSETWTAGNHLIGPDYEFMKFPASFQLFDQRISVWTKSGDQDAGATVNIDISFIYKLRTQDLGKLYGK